MAVSNGDPDRPHRGAVLTIGVTLNWMNGERETVKAEAPEPKEETPE